MTLSPRLMSALAIVGVFAAVLGGGLAGVALAERLDAPAHRDLVLADPAAASGGVEGLRSSGGFTGFDGPAALSGSVARTGKISPTQNGAFDVTSNGSTLAARTTSTARLFRIERAATPLSRGDAVQVRLDDKDAPLGVLRLPADLHTGENRPAPTPTASTTPAPR